MFDPRRPIRTRDGRSARIVTTNRVHVTKPIVALVMRPESDFEVPLEYSYDGRYRDSESPLDLVNLTEEHSYWINAYKNRSVTFHDTKTDADSYVGLQSPDCGSRVGCFEVVYYAPIGQS